MRDIQPWLALLALALVSAVLTWLARRYALRRQLLDHPGERRSHHVATPRGGGIAIVVTALVGLAAGALLYPAAAAHLAIFAAGLVLVAGIGWWDDHRPLPAVRRLLVHMLASVLLAGLVWQATGNALQAVLLFLVATALVNLWNFMDGINGIASGYALVGALSLAAVMPMPFALLAVVVAAGCLGFLPFNFPRARIFMGDVGSGALGYLMAALAGLASVVTSIHWLALLIPLSAFIVDAGFTLSSRMLSGQRWMEPHTQHVYQRAVKAGWSHTQVTGVYILLGLVGAAVLALSVRLAPLQQAGLALAWGALLACLWAVMRVRLRNY
ncbi:lipopolysaccharide biosynthesis protein [Stenotrophomonas sp. Betaine-02u-21]|jgi:UDP-N-acetylmuramyl pentapeptide phosphotransferase/UDP-N-acetylglucosamine-1-phosphate transferase|uniref:MraY family glycosyltransferase n=1 Tax=Stenotrophomonas TaxID=40323 RepID=UPI000C331556|nr:MULTISPECIES: glycosyltransferase family 4 protein [Stenotrophomonas]PKH76178.1 lipopolysaccharide biosynthesis protein [Stenotrophomonas sp. Betaine-02u-23]PKH77556.1 lipopolysaccharide biosynthesis protein [Stenotrophomonas sp. Betaine-02u-21]PKH97725.1 lipopolysaccharide biosynthesis protein [Stenotrophomonas sp. Bg11-02]